MIAPGSRHDRALLYHHHMHTLTHRAPRVTACAYWSALISRPLWTHIVLYSRRGEGTRRLLDGLGRAAPFTRHHVEMLRGMKALGALDDAPARDVLTRKLQERLRAHAQPESAPSHRRAPAESPRLTEPWAGLNEAQPASDDDDDYSDGREGCASTWHEEVGRAALLPAGFAAAPGEIEALEDEPRALREAVATVAHT